MNAKSVEEIRKMDSAELVELAKETGRKYIVMDYGLAKIMTEGYISEINRRGKEVAKRNKKPFYPLTFGKLMR